MIPAIFTVLPVADIFVVEVGRGIRRRNAVASNDAAGCERDGVGGQTVIDLAGAGGGDRDGCRRDVGGSADRATAQNIVPGIGTAFGDPVTVTALPLPTFLSPKFAPASENDTWSAGDHAARRKHDRIGCRSVVDLVGTGSAQGQASAA